MKQIFLLLGLLLVAVGCDKQLVENAPVEAAKSADAESDAPFVLETALAKAKAENKPVLLEFTGSDWCPPCKMLEKEVLGTDEFKQYAATNLIFGVLDFPQRKQQSEAVQKNNSQLSDKFAIRAFPTLVLLNGDGKELWRQEGFGGGNPRDFIAQIEAKKKGS